MDIDRKTAFAVLLDVEKNEAFSNLALNRRIKENQPQNPAFVRELVYGVLSDRPLFFLINSYTTGLAPSVLTYILETLLTPRYGGQTASQELGLPVRENGLILPCGASGRWTAGAQ